MHCVQWSVFMSRVSVGCMYCWEGCQAPGVCTVCSGLSLCLESLLAACSAGRGVRHRVCALCAVVCLYV